MSIPRNTIRGKFIEKISGNVMKLYIKLLLMN